MEQQGFTDVLITDRYRIGTGELFAFAGKRAGVRVKGAGDTEHDVTFTEADACFALPSIYFLLGRQAIKSMA